MTFPEPEPFAGEFMRACVRRKRFVGTQHNHDCIEFLATPPSFPYSFYVFPERAKQFEFFHHLILTPFLERIKDILCVARVHFSLASPKIRNSFPHSFVWHAYLEGEPFLQNDLTKKHAYSIGSIHSDAAQDLLSFFFQLRLDSGIYVSCFSHTPQCTTDVLQRKVRSK